MDNPEPLGPGNISYIAATIADGTATPDDARRLLGEFVRQAHAGTVEPQRCQRNSGKPHSLPRADRRMADTLRRIYAGSNRTAIMEPGAAPCVLYVSIPRPVNPRETP
jgi:hypothetical protein